MGRVVRPGGEIARERTARHVQRHHHIGSYAAVVLRGGYLEAGDNGRFRVEAGHVLIHAPFEAHQNHFAQGGADILNLPMPKGGASGFGRVADPDQVARIAERDAVDAAMALLELWAPEEGGCDDWPDRLAADLRADRVERIELWAEAAGLDPSTVSRGFRKAYGVSPRRFRVERRASRAARALGEERDGLAAIAADAGFADQPHMTRIIRGLFGEPPKRLRHRVKCVQDKGDGGL